MMKDPDDSNDPQVVFFETLGAADDACRDSPECAAYGTEIFQLGRGGPA